MSSAEDFLGADGAVAHILLAEHQLRADLVRVCLTLHEVLRELITTTVLRVPKKLSHHPILLAYITPQLGHLITWLLLWFASQYILE